MFGKTKENYIYACVDDTNVAKRPPMKGSPMNMKGQATTIKVPIFVGAGRGKKPYFVDVPEDKR